MKLCKAPFAVTSDGTVVINVVEFDGVRNVEDAVVVAKRQAAPIFIGVPLTKSEVRRVLARVGHGHREAAAQIVGARQGRRKA
jgi:hypothetical protein